MPCSGNKRNISLSKLPIDLQAKILTESLGSLKIDTGILLVDNLTNILALVEEFEKNSKIKFNDYQKNLIYKVIGELIKNSYSTEDIDEVFPEIAKIKKIKAVDFAQILLHAGADINAIDKYYHSPAIYQASKNNFPLVQFLVKNKANINIKNLLEETPLATAALNGSFKTVEFLINNGADVNLDNNTLDGAILSDIDSSDKIKLLLKKGANVSNKSLKIARQLGKKDILHLIEEKFQEPQKS